jgi:hypothetical protein
VEHPVGPHEPHDLLDSCAVDQFHRVKFGLPIEMCERSWPSGGTTRAEQAVRTGVRERLYEVPAHETRNAGDEDSHDR